MEKICGFYVSNMHLVTMILPYLKKQLSKRIKIETFFEESLNNNVKTILSNLVINEKEKKEILNINWENNTIKKYSIIEKRLKKILNKNCETIFLICGNKKHIQEINNILNEFLRKNTNFNKFKIINCYEVSEFDDNIKEVLDEHEYIFNTSGIHKIEEIFENYKKEIAN